MQSISERRNRQKKKVRRSFLHPERKRRVKNVAIPEEIQTLLLNDARSMAFMHACKQFCRTPVEDRVFGARALNQLSTYIKAIALRHNQNAVNNDHYQLFNHYFHYFNYNCPLIIPRKEIVVSD